MSDDCGSWRKSSHSGYNGNCIEVGSWRKSSRSGGGECLEVGGWRKSSLCADGNCIEVGHSPATVGVRDSKLADSPVLKFSSEAWAAFMVTLGRPQA